MKPRSDNPHPGSVFVFTVRDCGVAAGHKETGWSASVDRKNALSPVSNWFNSQTEIISQFTVGKREEVRDEKKNNLEEAGISRVLTAQFESKPRRIEVHHSTEREEHRCSAHSKVRVDV
jgi:hypothetical protein